jgi:hypothetical protein
LVPAHLILAVWASAVPEKRGALAPDLDVDRLPVDDLARDGIVGDVAHVD